LTLRTRGDLDGAFEKRPAQTKTGLVRLDQKTAEVRDALLYDFDIDDDDLKEAHKQYLAQAMQSMVDRIEGRKKTKLWGAHEPVRAGVILDAAGNLHGSTVSEARCRRAEHSLDHGRLAY
jgi:hypothetical protein